MIDGELLQALGLEHVAGQVDDLPGQVLDHDLVGAGIACEERGGRQRGDAGRGLRWIGGTRGDADARSAAQAGRLKSGSCFLKKADTISQITMLICNPRDSSTSLM